MRQALRPLVDRAGNRVVARQLGEPEGDEELAGDDDQPRPEHDRPAEADADAEVAERSGRDADEAKASAKFARNPSDRFSWGLMPSDSRCASSRAEMSWADSPCPVTISSYLRTARCELDTGGSRSDAREWSTADPSPAGPAGEDSTTVRAVNDDSRARNGRRTARFEDRPIAGREPQPAATASRSASGIGRWQLDRVDVLVDHRAACR